jgi:hypothetical protein
MKPFEAFALLIAALLVLAVCAACAWAWATWTGLSFWGFFLIYTVVSFGELTYGFIRIRSLPGG